jgi:hypothetical protein
MVACDPIVPQESVTFEFVVHGNVKDSFFASTNDRDTIKAARQQLALPISKRTLFPHGPISKGGGADNGKWSWHYVPNEWSLTEVSMELCDATPGYIEENLDTWLSEVGIFCPWNGIVYSEAE